MRNNLPPESKDELEPTFTDYSDREDLYGRNATLVAFELFGEGLQGAGRFYSAAGSDRDVPYKVESKGDDLTTYNMLNGEDTADGWRGLDGEVISEQQARTLANPPIDYNSPVSRDNNSSVSLSDTDK